MLGSAPGPRLRGEQPLANAVCSSYRSEITFRFFVWLFWFFGGFFFFNRHFFGRTLESVVLITLLWLQASLETPLQTKEHLSEGPWGFESHAHLPVSR